MGIKNGSLSLQVFYSITPLGEQIPDQLQDVKPPSMITETPVSYWVDVIELAGYKLATLRTSQRVVSKALLKAETDREIAAFEKAAGATFTNRKKRAEIQKVAFERLIPTAPIVHRDIETVWRTDDHFVYTTAVSDAAADRLRNLWAISTTKPLVLPGICEAAFLAAGVKLVDAPSCHGFATGEPIAAVDEFLTWLWFKWESNEWVDGLWGMFEEPLVLVGGRDDGTVTIKGGKATASEEAARALYTGKVAARARVTWTVDGTALTKATLSSSHGTALRGLKWLTDDKEVPTDSASAFQHRAVCIERARDEYFAMIGAFAKVRADAEAWAAEQVRVWEWIKAKAGKGKE